MLQVEAGEAEVGIGMIGTGSQVEGETLAASGTATTTGAMTTDQRKPLATRLKTEGDTAQMAVSMAVGVTPMVVVVVIAAMDRPTMVFRLWAKPSRISSLVALTSQGHFRMA